MGKKGPDRGNRAWLERYIYIANLRTLMRVIRNHGFFPEQTTDMITYAPQAYTVYQYMCFKIDDEKINFSTLYDSMLNEKTFGVAFGRAVTASTFDPTMHFISMLPFFTMSFIHHLKKNTLNLEEHPILVKGHYCGASKGNPDHKLDNLCFANKTLVDNQMVDLPTPVTKIRDVMLRNKAGSPRQVNNRELIAYCILDWSDRTKLDGRHCKLLKTQKSIWDHESNKAPLMEIVVVQLKDPPETLGPAKQTGASPAKAVKTSIDESELKVGLIDLAQKIIKLKDGFEESGDSDAKRDKLFGQVTSTILSLAATSNIGIVSSLIELTNEASSADEQSDSDGTDGDCDGIFGQETSTKKNVLKMLNVPIENAAKGKLIMVELNTDLLKKAMRWEHELSYSIEDVQHSRNFILFDTKKLLTIWKVYNSKFTGKKGPPKWSIALVQAIRECEAVGWVSSLGNEKSTGADSIIAIMKTTARNAIVEAQTMAIERATMHMESSGSSSEEDDIM